MGQTVKMADYRDNSPITRVQSVFSRKDLSNGEKVVLAEMIFACGYRGSICHGLKSFSERVGMSRSRTQVLLRGLSEKGFLVRKERIGRANEWIIPDQFPFQHNATDINTEDTPQPTLESVQVLESKPALECTPPRTNLDIPLLKSINKEKTYRCNANLKSSKTSNDKTVDMDLVHKIESILKTNKDRGCWIKIVKSCSPDIVCAAISSLKQAMNEQVVEKPAAYLVNTIKASYPDLFSITESRAHTEQPVATQPIETSHQKPVRWSDPGPRPMTEEEWKEAARLAKEAISRAGKKNS